MDDPQDYPPVQPAAQASLGPSFSISINTKCHVCPYRFRYFQILLQQGSAEVQTIQCPNCRKRIFVLDENSSHPSLVLSLVDVAANVEATQSEGPPVSGSHVLRSLGIVSGIASLGVIHEQLPAGRAEEAIPDQGASLEEARSHPHLSSPHLFRGWTGRGTQGIEESRGDLGSTVVTRTRAIVRFIKARLKGAVDTAEQRARSRRFPTKESSAGMPRYGGVIRKSRLNQSWTSDPTGFNWTRDVSPGGSYHSLTEEGDEDYFEERVAVPHEQRDIPPHGLRAGGMEEELDDHGEGPSSMASNQRGAGSWPERPNEDATGARDEPRPRPYTCRCGEGCECMAAGASSCSMPSDRQGPLLTHRRKSSTSIANQIGGFAPGTDFPNRTTSPIHAHLVSLGADGANATTCTAIEATSVHDTSPAPAHIPSSASSLDLAHIGASPSLTLNRITRRVSVERGE